ncbi:uncharacterized protein LOC143470196 [Clavelina lepadiformis]|uniref:uncharacterized protein LOC143470196 n=1 Tax=Clavelina lepadiformis TaxID=159417 RepID=UPI0040416E34
MTSKNKMLTVKELKSRTDDNEMDLSLLGITKIPVKEIATVRKANVLDLSCNRIVQLPDEFCTTLQYLVKLDLSKNLITDLPADVYKLQQLKHLDLFQNKLSMIPVGFSRLDNLRWLDLKDNPLDSSYFKIVGDCLDDKQCRQCAINVVTAMKSLASEQERQKQKVLKAEREREQRKHIEEQKQAQQRKLEKQLDKERKRKQWEAEQAKLVQAAKPVLSTEQRHLGNGEVQENAEIAKVLDQKNNRSWISTSFTLLIACTAILVGIYIYCKENATDKACKSYNAVLLDIQKLTKPHFKYALEFMKDGFDYSSEKILIFNEWLTGVIQSIISKD